MPDPQKPIVISTHAADCMRQRGATQAEVESAVRSAAWQPAQRGKWHAKFRRGARSQHNRETRQ